ncbi:MAG: hypothetical protein H0X25_07385 [Acidobacteriales bacterium]|nr:hypothetical protein [Terriglobales bacterium]
MASKRKPQGTGDSFVDSIVEQVDRELGPEPDGAPATKAFEALAERPTPESPRARVIPTVEQRIAHIVDLMEQFAWVRGKTAGLLAADWGLSQSTVENYSAEAHRRIVGDKDEAIRDITLGARKLLKQAVEMGACRDFAAVANILADVSGAKAPTRQEVAVETISPATAREVMADLFGPVTPQDSSDVVESE